jgi:hypothetical protein
VGESRDLHTGLICALAVSDLKYWQLCACPGSVLFVSSQLYDVSLSQVIEIHDSTPDKKRKTLEYRYHLLQVRAESIDVDSVDAANLDAYDSPRLFLRAGQLVHLDTFLCTHGQSGRLYGACCRVLSFCILQVAKMRAFNPQFRVGLVISTSGL